MLAKAIFERMYGTLLERPQRPIGQVPGPIVKLEPSTEADSTPDTSVEVSMTQKEEENHGDEASWSELQRPKPTLPPTQSLTLHYARKPKELPQANNNSAENETGAVEDWAAKAVAMAQEYKKMPGWREVYKQPSHIGAATASSADNMEVNEPDIPSTDPRVRLYYNRARWLVHCLGFFSAPSL